MLKKLMKYDFKSLFNVLIPVYGILLFLSLFNRLSYYLSDNINILEIPAGFITLLYVIVLIGVPVATFIISIIKYYKNLAGDEGYLMHTLPVTTKELVLSKLITYFVSMIVSVLVSIICLFIGSYGMYFDSEIFTKLNEIIKETDKLFLIIMSITCILSVVLQQLIIYASIALGQKQNTNKVIYSIVFGIVLYNVNQVISAVVLLVPIIFIFKDWSSLSQDNPPMNMLNGYLGASIVLSILFIIGYYILTTKTLEKKLNLE